MKPRLVHELEAGNRAGSIAWANARLAILLPAQWCENIGACEVPIRECNRPTAAIPMRLRRGSFAIAQPQAECAQSGHYLPGFRTLGRLARGELIKLGTSDRSGLALRLGEHH